MTAPKDLRLLLAAVGAWAALALAITRPLTVQIWLAVAAAAAAVTIVMALRRPAGRALALTLGLAAALLGAAAGHSAVQRQGPIAGLARTGALATMSATVLTEPTPMTSRAGVVLRLEVTTVEAQGLSYQVATPVLVFADASWSDLAWREQVTVTGRLRLPPQGSADIAILAPIGGYTSIKPSGPLFRLADRLRQGLREASKDLSHDARGLLPSLVVGDTSGTDASLTEAMRTTGLTHLAAVSGSNVAIVVGAVAVTARAVGVRRRLRPLVAALALGFFVLLARPEPSVQRAAVMGAIGILAVSTSRRSLAANGLGAAIVVLLVIDPWMARSYGFVLSVLATLGLVVFAGSWGEAIDAHLPDRLRGAGAILAVPLAAQLMCAPVLVLLQGKVSLVSVLANVLVAPLVPVATIGGLLALLVAPISLPVAKIVAWIPGWWCDGIALTARALARVPYAQVQWPDGALGAWLLAALTVAVVIAWPVLIRRWRLLVGVAVIAGLAFWLPVAGRWPPRGTALVACDVGQGDAVVVLVEPGRALVVDTGPDPDRIDRCLTRLGVTAIDVLVLTHYDQDHIGGTAGAIRNRRVGRVLVTPTAEPAERADAFGRWAAVQGLTLTPVTAGTQFRDGPVTATVWWPARELREGSIDNNNSLVLAVDTGAVQALLLADIEREAGAALAAEIAADPAKQQFVAVLDVVKTPHHGSANIDRGLMTAIAAPIAVISVGADNDYGHPTAVHLDLLRSLGASIFRTDQQGDLAILGGATPSVVTSRRRWSP